MAGMSHYLDHAASTDLREGALAAWQRASAIRGNPSALHGDGRAARRLVEESREQLATALGVEPGEVVFTSGGTEADNLAVLGLATAQRRATGRSVVMMAPIEHPAVLETARPLRQQGFDIVDLPVGRDGTVDLAASLSLIDQWADRLALISLMSVNNETGAIQPVAELAAAAHRIGLPLHCDAVQAIGHLTIPTRAAGGSGEPSGWPDAIALSGHKLGGPIGVGALVVARGRPISPTTYGGGQERQLRSGTVAVGLVAALASAVTEAVAATEPESARLAGLSDRLRTGLAGLGAEVIRPALPAPHIVYALFPGARADALLMLLDQQGISVSTGSACTAGVAQPSHVLEAMGYSPTQASSGLRFSFGWTSTPDDVDAALAALPAAWAAARTIGRAR